MSLQKSILKDPIFYGKVLLFGEYGIIEDSMGLSIPYNFYNGAFNFPEDPTEKDLESNEHLKKYLTYLKESRYEGDLPLVLDLEQFEKDISKGLSFRSTHTPRFWSRQLRGLGSRHLSAVCTRTYQSK
jgi:mevalonate kinase